jgi:phosphatidate cytidylyltransferase
MLKRRVITALVVIPPFVATLYVLDTFWVALLLGAFVALGAWEWTGLSAIQGYAKRIFYIFVVISIGGIGVAGVFSAPVLLGIVMGLAALWWVWMLVELAARTIDADAGGSPGSNTHVAGVLILVPAWLAAVYLHHEDPMRPAALLYLFVLVWIADAAAYFVGMRFGKTKLAPRISPGKTVEGLVGGLCAALALGYFSGVWIWPLDPATRWWWMALAGVVMLFSVLGDLVESQYKRLAGVKDSGRLLPGHGGVLDRIDAFTGAAPVYVMGWYVLTRIGP